MNIALIFETALFLLAAFLIGSILGYLIRCMFFRPKVAKAATPAPVTISPKPTAEASIAKAAPVTATPKATSKPTPPKPAIAKPAAPKVTKSISATTAQSDDKPIGLSGPRNGNKDDLKRIKGIGVKIEDTLNGLGIYHFDQVADWSSETIEWVNGFLSFKGRIQREEWISQAKDLAERK